MTEHKIRQPLRQLLNLTLSAMERVLSPSNAPTQKSRGCIRRYYMFCVIVWVKANRQRGASQAVTTCVCCGGHYRACKRFELYPICTQCSKQIMRDTVRSIILRIGPRYSAIMYPPIQIGSFCVRSTLRKISDLRISCPAPYFSKYTPSLRRCSVCPISGIALLVEIATHLILWRGTACFHFNPFVEVSNRPINTPHKPATTIYPSTSRRQLLEGSAYGSRTPSAGRSITLLPPEPLNT